MPERQKELTLCSRAFHVDWKGFEENRRKSFSQVHARECECVCALPHTHSHTHTNTHRYMHHKYIESVALPAGTQGAFRVK